MFWIGFAAGIMATMAFLVTEHLIGQWDWKTPTALGKTFSQIVHWRDRQLLNWETLEWRRQEHKDTGRPFSMK
jgi:hypothetical protein